jgi:hypothetical protein
MLVESIKTVPSAPALKIQSPDIEMVTEETALLCSCRLLHRDVLRVLAEKELSCKRGQGRREMRTRPSAKPRTQTGLLALGESIEPSEMAVTWQSAGR